MSYKTDKSLNILLPIVVFTNIGIIVKYNIFQKKDFERSSKGYF